ncbi:hypothetical protein ABID81_000326 [Frigoribacterium sp. PvP054]|uniref:glycosyltransferase family 2 protein n=1 Tax=Frigoribacterium sp. PvP054 TaxID=3156438 RepID=UPI0033926C82
MNSLSLVVDPLTGAAPVDRHGTMLTVVIPTHDVEPWIDELLTSVLAQGLPGMEVIVVDDHSVDGTLERVRRRADLDPRVKVIEARDAGGATARNIGVASSSGRYIVFADGDDIVPHGAYVAMVEAAESSGSDIVFGDYLKFSTTSTWNPTKNWPAHRSRRSSVPFASEPSLIRGRACWNKLFRRSLLTDNDITFPEVPRSNDIVPMTRAYLAARRVDVVDECVYLYRQRPGTSSMTARAGAELASVSYLTQEAECARLVVSHGDDAVMSAYSSLIFDSDAWVHLHGYLLGLQGSSVSEEVLAAVDALFDAAPRSGLLRAAAHKRLLFGLLRVHETGAALALTRAVARRAADGAYDVEGLRAVFSGVRVLAGALADEPSLELDVPRLVAEAVIVPLVHDGDSIGSVALSGLVRDIASSGLLDGRDLELSLPAGLARALGRSVLGGDAEAVAALSGLQKIATVTTDAVGLHEGRVQMSGPRVWARSVSAELHLVAQSGDDVRHPLPVETGQASWSVDIADMGRQHAGRYSVELTLSTGDFSVSVPVVSARMPLPVPAHDDVLAVFSDRKRGWRMVVERLRKPPMAHRVLAAGRGAGARLLGRRTRGGQDPTEGLLETR